MAKAKATEPAFVPSGAEPVMVGKAILGYRTRGRHGRKAKPHKASTRLAEFQTVLIDIFSGPVDTDDAQWLLEPFAATVAWRIEAEAAKRGDAIPYAKMTRLIAEHVQQWLPRLPVSDIGAMAALMAASRPKYTADQIAKVLNVSLAQRQRLGLKTIGACDVSKKTRQKRLDAARAERSKQTKTTKRRQAGMRPQSESMAAIAREIGVNRDTLYDWKKKGIFDTKIAERRAQLSDSSGAHILSPCRRAKSVGSASNAKRRDGAAASSSESPVKPPVDHDAAARSDGREASCSIDPHGDGVAQAHSRASASAIASSLKVQPATHVAQVAAEALRAFSARHKAAKELQHAS